MARKPDRGGLPSRQQILDFMQSSSEPAGKREIARAFRLSAHEKIALKALLKDMADEGLIDSAPGRAFHKAGGVPKVTVLRVVDVDDSGRAVAVPERWEAETVPPRLRVMERKGRGSALGVGDRILARTEEGERGWIAHPMKKLLKGSELVLGVVHREGNAHWLRPVEKKERRELPIQDLGGAEPGDLVLAEKTGRPPRLAARVDTILGDPFAPRSFSLIAIHKHGIPHEFPQSVTEEAERVAALDLGAREDLTHIPIVAIDPADARDHDDAVWAARDEDPANPGGWKAIVAIADVSFYVRPGSALDKEARKRGNSVYFPDRVVPMLPELLSAEVCSLKAGEDRAALACHLQVTKSGALKSWRFTRARVRIAANIAYEDAQAAIDGGDDRIEVSSPTCSMPEIPSPMLDLLRPLWACWRALNSARAKRAPLELDLPERRVMLDEKGRILSVAPRERLDAHKLIEDYMIAANVAAAKALEAKQASVMYRVHEPPSREKLVALKDYLKTLGVEFALGQVVRPETFNRIIERIRGGAAQRSATRHSRESGNPAASMPSNAPKKLDPRFRGGDEEKGDGRGQEESAIVPQVMEQILRTQTQAYYAPRNQGHFGLALGSYAHFTSPIRRYADLVVHRALVRVYRLGEGGLTEEEAAAMEVTGELISNLERRAMIAERETMDRYVAAYLADQVGALIKCRITGVQPFGFFAAVEELGGDGLVPAAILGAEYFRYDEASQSLIGEESGTTYTIGQRLTLRLAEAEPVSGGLRFELPEAPPPRGQHPARRMQGRRGRPPNIRHRGRR